MNSAVYEGNALAKCWLARIYYPDLEQGGTRPRTPRHVFERFTLQERQKLALELLLGAAEAGSFDAHLDLARLHDIERRRRLSLAWRQATHVVERRRRRNLANPQSRPS